MLVSSGWCKHIFGDLHLRVNSINGRFDLLLIPVSAKTFRDTDELGFDIVSIENAKLRPHGPEQEGPGGIFGRANVREDDVHYGIIALGIAFAKVG